jgi:hypothetical protein
MTYVLWAIWSFPSAVVAFCCKSGKIWPYPAFRAVRSHEKIIQCQPISC